MKPQQRKKLKDIETNIARDKMTLQNFKDVLFRKVESLSETQYALKTEYIVCK